MTRQDSFPLLLSLQIFIFWCYLHSSHYLFHIYTDTFNIGPICMHYALQFRDLGYSSMSTPTGFCFLHCLLGFFSFPLFLVPSFAIFSFSLFLLSNPYLLVFVLSYLILYFTKAPLFPNERKKGRGSGLQGRSRGAREVQGGENKIKIHWVRKTSIFSRKKNKNNKKTDNTWTM